MVTRSRLGPSTLPTSHGLRDGRAVVQRIVRTAGSAVFGLVCKWLATGTNRIGKARITDFDVTNTWVRTDPSPSAMHLSVYTPNGTKSTADSLAIGATMHPYDIPMRALIARDVTNLLLGGRCISGDFIAHSSYRVTGTAAATGQAAGVAAALSANLNTTPALLKCEEIKKHLHNITLK